MERFPVKFFRFATRYPDSGARVQFGNSYQFDVMPSAPDQRLFTLSLSGMKYFLDQNNNIDTRIEIGRNAGVLEAFYQQHKRAMPFIFWHPIYGDLTVKFNQPLNIPEGIPGGDGALSEFQVELIEVP